MWRNVNISWSDINTIENFILKSLNRDNTFSILVSDFQNIWSENISSELLCSRCKDVNPLVDASDDRLYQQVVSLVDGTRNSVLTAKCKPDEVDSLYLRAECKLSGFPFVFEFHLKLADRSLFYKEFTEPLALMVLELEARQQQLYSILKKKDAEIAEYRMNGAQLSRKNIETAVFDVCDFEFSRYLTELPTNPIEKIFEHKTKELYSEVRKKCEQQKLKNVATIPEPMKVESENHDVPQTSNGSVETTPGSSPNKRNATADDKQNSSENVKEEGVDSQEPEKKVEPTNVPPKKPKKAAKKKLGL